MAKYCPRKISSSKENAISYQILSTLLLGLIVIVIPRPARAWPNRIEVLQGVAQIKRQGSQEYVPAYESEEIRSGDLIWPEEGTIVKVRCGDSERKLRSVDAGIPSGLSIICPDNSRNTDARGNQQIFLPLLRGEWVAETALLNETPMLRWPAVTGAERYRLWLTRGNEVVWESVVIGTETSYEGPVLESGTRYRMVVVTDDIPPKNVYQLEFKLLTPKQRERIENEITSIKQLDTTETAKAILLADYLMEQLDSLDPASYLAAATPLENLGPNLESAIIHRLLGDIYIQLGWIGEAEVRYKKALRLGIRTRNYEEKAQAHEGLAHVHLAIRNLLESKRSLNKAQENYHLAGNESRALMISRWLDKINTLISHD